MAGNPLFVYGTLRDPDVLALVIGRQPAAAQRLHAVAVGHAVVWFPGRTYPAIRTLAGAEAPGLALSGLSAAELEALDRFEGEEYFRGEIEIIVNGGALAADVYWPGVAVAEGPAWRLEAWQERYKAAFLNAEAQSITEWRERLTGLSL